MQGMPIPRKVETTNVNAFAKDHDVVELYVFIVVEVSALLRRHIKSDFPHDRNGKGIYRARRYAGAMDVEAISTFSLKKSLCHLRAVRIVGLGTRLNRCIRRLGPFILGCTRIIKVSSNSHFDGSFVLRKQQKAKHPCTTRMLAAATIPSGLTKPLRRSG